MIYQLGTRLGGRREVVETPMEELLGYLISDFKRKEEEANEEAQRLYLNHMSRMVAQPQSKEQQKANEKFIKQIDPNNQRSSTLESGGHEMVGTSDNQVIGSDDWSDFDKLKALENR
ncbi:hypothetical protein NW133_07415 [Staphylococcus pettenkoferi]|uniref:DUF4355 domain-containing protein n=1 Tax=Staphylococcus pettenkoferi TaxID=170573 RepID=A0ABT4BL05_9STAP|nr:hypothetical protein [Staphylococcus pettenkoferi]MCY1583356.1 hypothetical protein [Staphylococcus pettenkoferi]